MERKCEQCGGTFEAKTKLARFCRTADCDKARARVWKQKERAEVVDLPERSSDELGDGLAAVTIAELTKAGCLNSVAGQAAVEVARRIERSSFGDTGSSFAALIRELRSSVDAALATAKPAGPVAGLRDELEARRERKASA